jgi:hypothetical protein
VRDPWLAAILVLAAALRVYGLGHGLPFVYNPDEVNIMARALSIARDPNPHYFLYPNLFFFALFGVMGGLFVVGRLVGRYPSLGAFQARFFEDPTDFYLVGRAVGVVAALLTIVLTYHLASRHFGRGVARAAALFLAVAYVNVRDSHYLKHDVPTALLVVLALIAFDRIRERSDLRTYLISGLAMGVAFATHYYTIFLAPAFVLYHFTVSGARQLGKVVAAGAVAAVTFILLSPFVVIDLPVAIDHMIANREVVVDRSLSSGSFLLPSLPAYLRFLAEQGLGYPLLALVVAGGVLMARRNFRALVLWGGFPLLFFVFITYTFFAGRYLNPILPSLAVAGGLAIGTLQERLGTTAAAIVAGIACLQPIYNDFQVDRLFAGKDTRTLAREWVVENVPDGTPIALQSYSVPLPQSASSVQESLARNDALEELDRKGKYAHLLSRAEDRHPSYPLFFVGRGDEKNRTYFDYPELISKGLAPLRESGVARVVLRYPPGTPPPVVAALFERVSRQGKMLARFSPFRSEETERHPYMDNEDWAARSELAHKGPLVEIWSLEGQ